MTRRLAFILLLLVPGLMLLPRSSTGQGKAAPDSAPNPGKPKVYSAQVERDARALEKMLVAPCCFKGTLVDHASPIADQMRSRLRAMLTDGWSIDRVLGAFKKQYGQAVLAEPPKGGFSSFVLYGVPFGLVLIGLLVATVLIARRREEEAPETQLAIPEDHELPEALSRRIDALVHSTPSRETR